MNQALEVDKYPLPKPDDLFATLAGGKKFSTLDLSRAYQQLLLDDESAEYVTGVSLLQIAGAALAAPPL